MDSKSCTIGVLGGMGTYATIHLFRQYAAVFPAEKEWERPRIIIDNRCTMPSRVRAALYGENRQQLVNEMSDSVRNLEKSGCNRILLACNTAHLFLQDIVRQVPEADGKIVNIIEICVDGLRENDEKEVFLLASEGTIDSGIYQEACSARGIRCEVPYKEEYSQLRECIEAVKRDRYSDAVRAAFAKLVLRGSTCVLGCTELPILYERYRNLCSDVRVYDPTYMALARIRKEFSAGR